MSRKAMRGEARAWALAAAEHAGEECLLWPFSAMMTSGYGAIRIANRKMTGAHRFVCELAKGAPPSSKMDCAHSCGNKLCCNPKHLRWATHLENEADKAAHGTTNAGERNGQAKLSGADVAQIRARYSGGSSGASLSRLYGVSAASISLIVNGHHWRSV
jgi:hypothetical protein